MTTSEGEAPRIARGRIHVSRVSARIMSVEICAGCGLYVRDVGISFLTGERIIYRLW